MEPTTSRSLTLPEEILLLLLHDTKGRSIVDDTSTSAALAGAALVELTLDGALRLTTIDEPQAKKGRLVATGQGARDDRLAALVEPAGGRKPKDAIDKVAGFGWGSGQGKNLKDGLLHDLAAQGLLSQGKGRLLGIFPTTSWPQGPRPEVEADLIRRVRDAVATGLQPDQRTAALVALLHAAGALPKLLPDVNKKLVKRRGQEISESDWAGPAVREAVQSVQAAMIAVVVASTSVATTST